MQNGHSCLGFTIKRRSNSGHCSPSAWGSTKDYKSNQAIININVLTPIKGRQTNMRRKTKLQMEKEITQKNVFTT